MTLTHFDAEGRAHMVDVSDKPVTDRIAVAEAVVRMTAETLALVTGGRAKKGDVMGVARLAGIMAAKRRGVSPQSANGCPEGSRTSRSSPAYRERTTIIFPAI